MYQLRSRSFAYSRLVAITAVTFALLWQFAANVPGQETPFDEPREFQHQQREATAASNVPIPQSHYQGTVSQASFQAPENDAHRGVTPAVQAGNTSAPPNRASELTPDTAADQQPGKLGSKQLDAVAPLATPRTALPAGPAPLPISRNAASSSPAANDHAADQESTSAASGMDTLFTVAGSLGLVLGLFMVTMWCLRRAAPKAVRPLPVEVVEVLGRSALSGRQQMHLIRFGGKLVLAAQTPEGIDAISEITDPAEVDRLIGYCEQTRPSSSTATFRGILDRLDERGARDADEPPRRPNREYPSLAGLRRGRPEDEYA